MCVFFFLLEVVVIDIVVHKYMMFHDVDKLIATIESARIHPARLELPTHDRTKLRVSAQFESPNKVRIETWAPVELV